MTDLRLHLAPNAPWILLAALTVVLGALAVWSYRFRMPPLPPLSRRVFVALRAIALALLLWLLAQPVLERVLPASGRRVLVLVDRSNSMDLSSDPARPGADSRRSVSERVTRELQAALRGRAATQVRGFAATLEGDSARADSPREATALGDALLALAQLPAERRPDGVVVVSDGAVNAGADPVAAARALGVPVHAVLVGAAGGHDRAVASVEASSEARVGEATPVRVHVQSNEERGTPITVRLREGGREVAHASVIAPGSGAEAVAELRVTPSQAGLAVWRASVDSLARDAAPANDARGVAVQVAPGRLGVLVVSAGLNWDLTFLRRALVGDSTVKLDTRVRDAAGWRALESDRSAPLVAADLNGQAVVVLDALAAADAGAPFDAALERFVRTGGGLLVLPGPGGLQGMARGRFARELQLPFAPSSGPTAAPMPTAAAAELLAWDDDAARGLQAWSAAAPLDDVAPIAPAASDRVLLAARAGGPPLALMRRIGRGPVLLVNGTGLWRWSLSGNDDLQGERGRRLWRRVVRWLSEPVQGEALRVRPERWLSANGEPVLLVASLQDAAFRPVAGARLQGEANDGRGHTRALEFAPREAGSYTASLTGLEPGRWQVSARATQGGRELGVTRTEFAVDTWSLEALRAEPDSATLAAVANASGGSLSAAASAAGWARSLDTRALVRPRTSSTRMWESPWLFAAVIALLSAEWAWRRRRGLP